MGHEFWISSGNPQSDRVAIVADEGESVWLYLTEPGGEPVARDCWLINRVPAPTAESLQARREELRERQLPPPAPQEVVHGPAQLEGVLDASRVSFAWTPDGDGVGAWIDGALAGFILADEPRGRSARLRVSCPWGEPMDLARYAERFEGMTLELDDDMVDGGPH
jgi:hypothetical protein